MKYWTSYDVTVRARRSRVSIASRLFGLLILFLAVVFWPTAVMAADSGVETQRNTAVVFTMLVLFVGSVTGGVLFVSPLGRRFNRPPVAVAATEVTIQTVSATAAQEPEMVASLVLAPIPPADIPAEPSYYLPLPKPEPVGGLIEAPALLPLRPLPLEPLPLEPLPAEPQPADPMAAPPMPVAQSRAPRVGGWHEQDLRGWPLADIRAQPLPQSRDTMAFPLETQPQPSQRQPKKSPWSTNNPVFDGLWNRGGRATS
jgi:hypothetical protein